MTGIDNKNIRMLKFYISIMVGILLVSSSFAQFDMYNTNYNYSQLAFNPAFAGHRNDLSLTGMGRKQWIGIENSPSTFMFLGHMSIIDNFSDCRVYSRENARKKLVPKLNNQVGMGLVFLKDEIGVQSTNLMRLSYSYKIKFSSKKKLSFGIQASVIYFKQQFTKLDDLGSDDPIFDENVNLTRFNAGAGIMYESDLFYIGASVPDVMDNRTSERETAELIIGRQYFLIGGYTFYVSKFLLFKPSLMLRYIENQSMQFDINTNLVLNDRVLLGCSYRYNNSLNTIFEIYISDNFRVGYAMDYSIGPISKASSGSNEIILNYTFNTCKKRIVNPRFL